MNGTVAILTYAYCCIHAMKAEKSLNHKFGKLVVIEILPSDKFKHKRALCRCDCGNEKIFTMNRLRNGEASSCGCFRKQTANDASEIAYRKGKENGRIKNPVIGSAKHVYNSRYKDGNLSFDDFMIMSQRDCYYCGGAPSNVSNHYITRQKKYSEERISNGYFKYNGLDRIDNSKSHDLDNVVPCCIHCNKAKLDRDKEEFLFWVKKVYENCIIKSQ